MTNRQWRATAITVSTRCAAGTVADTSGQIAAEILTASGFEVTRALCPDGIDAVQAELNNALANKADVVFTLGGTGINPNDFTPEAVQPMLEREVPGIAELVRSIGMKANPMAAISRSVAGTIGSTLVITLPGSPKAARESLEPILVFLPHALEQMAGGDH